MEQRRVVKHKSDARALVYGGVSSEVRGLESVRHEHLAPVPFLPPVIDYHFKPDLEFCAFCPFHYDYNYDVDIFEACLRVSGELKALKKGRE